MGTHRVNTPPGENRDVAHVRRPRKVPPGGTAVIRTKPVKGVGRFAARHWCPSCGLRRRLCRCDNA